MEPPHTGPAHTEIASIQWTQTSVLTGQLFGRFRGQER
jgi:hypothetical protein